MGGGGAVFVLYTVNLSNLPLPQVDYFIGVPTDPFKSYYYALHRPSR